MLKAIGRFFLRIFKSRKFKILLGILIVLFLGYFFYTGCN